MSLNNREIAILLWILLGLLWALTRKETRRLIGEMARTVFSVKLTLPVLMFAGWVVLLVRFGAFLGLWQSSLLKGTLVWFITAGLVMFGNFQKMSKERDYAWRRCAATLEISTAITFLTGLFAMSLIWELLLVPLLVILGGVLAVSAMQSEYRQVKVLLDKLLIWIGLMLVAFAVGQLIENWGALRWHDLALQFFLPIWLTVLTLPFIYVLSLCTSYSATFRRLRWAQRGQAVDWRIKFQQRLAILITLNLKHRAVAKFVGGWGMRLAETRSFGEARQLAKRFLGEQEWTRTTARLMPVLDESELPPT